MDHDPHAAAQKLLKNENFLDLFQRALAGGKGTGNGDVVALMKNIPKEGDPKRDAWLRKLQKSLKEEAMKEAKKELEKVHNDENGQWMYIMPEPGFCIKCTVSGGCKAFINICEHERIAEPIPILDDEHKSSEDDEVRFRIPLSCGQARPDTDKGGKPCKVYDVIVNPATVKRCGEEHEFRRFVAALCMQWIKQKYEPTMNADEFRNLNFKAKGQLEPQRIRLSNLSMPKNAMNDEINLPTEGQQPTAPTHVGGACGSSRLIEEVNTPAAAHAARGAVPEVVKVAMEGSYVWSTHAKPLLSPFFHDNVPARYYVELFIPGIQSIREVCVKADAKKLECFYESSGVDAGGGVQKTGKPGRSPFLSVVFDYPVDADTVEAKFVKKNSLLKMRFDVRLPDETDSSRTKAGRDATELEEEEERQARKERDAEWEAQRERVSKQKEEEAKVMAERKKYVENLSAVQAGELPPSIRCEIDSMAKEQLPGLLIRLEGRVRKGDSVDDLLDKLAEPILEALCNYIRDKLSLQPRCVEKTKKHVHFEEIAKIDALKAADPVKYGCMDSAPSKKDDEKCGTSDEGRIEYNNASRSEKLFGLAFHNRYLFALDQ